MTFNLVIITDVHFDDEDKMVYMEDEYIIWSGTADEVDMRFTDQPQNVEILIDQVRDQIESACEHIVDWYIVNGLTNYEKYKADWGDIDYRCKRIYPHEEKPLEAA